MVDEVGRVVDSGPTNCVPEPLPASRFSISHQEWHHRDRLIIYTIGMNGFAAAQKNGADQASRSAAATSGPVSQTIAQERLKSLASRSS
jgi:hypothetical protein